MAHGKLYINGAWREGRGAAFSSTNPATGETIWRGNAATGEDIATAIKAAHAAWEAWGSCSAEERLTVLKRFQAVLETRKQALSHALAEETGKVLWDATSEITAMTAKLNFTVAAYRERTGEKFGEGQGFKTALRHRSHGVVAVYGPYNFPAHLPNGHILPALLAGNCVLFKPSELTPHVAELTLECWHEAGVPPGVIQLMQGERETGRLLSQHAGLDGLYFTGSSAVGILLARQFAETPGKILALELGGNNPLIVHEVKDVKAASYWTVQSAYQTTGQRCTCARRLIVPKGNDAYIDALVEMTKTIKVGPFTDTPEPYIGPLISNKEAESLLGAQEAFLAKGGKALVAMQRLKENLPFVTAGLIDVTDIKEREDREWFGPLLQLIRVADMDAAIAEANDTRYGLSSGLFSDNREHYDHFIRRIRAGIANWNRPLTGSSGNLPFGGMGLSGNHRPAAYYAADYCAFPVASNEAETLSIPANAAPGLSV